MDSARSYRTAVVFFPLTKRLIYAVYCPRIRIFISYQSLDKAFAKGLADRLENRWKASFFTHMPFPGVPIPSRDFRISCRLLDTDEDIRASTDIFSAIKEEMRPADLCVIVNGEATATSSWVITEVVLTLDRMKPAIIFQRTTAEHFPANLPEGWPVVFGDSDNGIKQLSWLIEKLLHIEGQRKFLRSVFVLGFGTFLFGVPNLTIYNVCTILGLASGTMVMWMFANRSTFDHKWRLGKRFLRATPEVADIAVVADTYRKVDINKTERFEFIMKLIAVLVCTSMAAVVVSLAFYSVSVKLLIPFGTVLIMALGIVAYWWIYRITRQEM